MANHKYSHWLPPLLKTEGVTIGKTIYFKDADPPSDLVVHEMVHIAQYARYGTVGFLFIYGFNHWEAYYRIPFEIEAYTAQRRYLEDKDANI